MGLATRIVPTLLVRGDQLVKGVGFDSWRSVGHPVQAVRVYNARSVDELAVLDIAATPNGAGPNLDLMRKLADVCFMPLTIGGGVRNIRDVRDLLNAGADKVALCTAAFERPTVVSECARRFGSQAIVVAIDVRAGTVWVHCGHNDTKLDPVLAAQMMEAEGAGEILLTSVERDGTLSGYDLDLVQRVSAAVGIPVVASGGAGKYEHFYEAIKAGASAVAASAMFAWTDQTPKGAAQFLFKRGIEVRL